MELRIAASESASLGAGVRSPVELSPVAGALVVEFAAKLQQRLDAEGDDALDALDVGRVADRLVASVPSTQHSEWDELIGPFYDTAALVAWKRVTRQRLSILRRQHRLLSVRTRDGVTLHPSFQFDTDGGLTPALDGIVPLLQPALADDWSVALWFNTPIDEWQGRTPAEMLRGSAEDQESVRLRATEDAATLLASRTGAPASA
ncbi:hypothetical protein [Agrococcus citreus]|uniref:hypothetical protein n=1 Tax=Agrococcus citreus TaxID=84643 RepID=UPI0031D06CDA